MSFRLRRIRRECPFFRSFRRLEFTRKHPARGTRTGAGSHESWVRAIQCGLLLVWVLAYPFFYCFAQHTEPRLKVAIRDSSRTTLAGSRGMRLRDSEDQGAVSGSEAVSGLTLVLQRSTEQEADLQRLLLAQQDTKSPLYHQWLTPDDFGKRFGLADEDLTKTQTWLRLHGFSIDGVSRSRDRITFSGTAAQIHAAFGTELHRYATANGELHVAPQTDLQLPTDLAVVTLAVLHLTDFRPKPSMTMEQGPAPTFTSLASQAHYLTPDDLVTMYDMRTLAQGFITGEGQSIAVLGQSYVDTSFGSAIRNFQSTLGLQFYGATAVLVPNSGVQAISPGDQGESELDVEYAGGVAPGAQVFVVYVGANPNYNVFDSLAYAIDMDISPVLSLSYSSCELLISPTEIAQSNALFAQATAQGQTLVAAAGDSGSTGCADYGTASGLTTTQTQSLAVGFPADSSAFTSVGGTQMAPGTYSAGNTTYWASATNSDLNHSLLSYVPEVVWNEDTASGILAAGGGGTSTVFPRPTWQTGVPGLPAGNFRVLPDVALQSSLASPGFLFCTSDGSQACTSGLRGSNGSYMVAGGTSFAAPTFAAMLAVVNQAEKSFGQGNVNPVLYGLAADPATYAAAFHDVQAGTTACRVGVANCSTLGQSGYNATVGYDEATGLGSVDVGALIQAWPASQNASLLPSNIVLQGPQYTADPGSTTSVDITVGAQGYYPSAPLPTGTLTILVDGSVVASGLGLMPSKFAGEGVETTYNFVAPAAPGSHLLRVVFSGDAAYAPSFTTASVLVGDVKATGNFSLTAGNLSIANGSTGSESITLMPSGGYSGRVVWSLTAAAASTTTTSLNACYRIASGPVNGVTSAKLTIGVGSACNSALPQVRMGFGSIAKTTPGITNGATPWHRDMFDGLAGGLLCCGVLARRTRRSRTLRLFTPFFFFAILAGLSGCGGSPTSSSGTPASPSPVSTPAVVYNMSLSGRDSVNTSINTSAHFTLTVQ